MTPQRILLFEQTISSRSYLINPSACQLLDPPRYAAAAALLAVVTRTHLFISSSRQTEMLSTQSSARVRERGEGGVIKQCPGERSERGIRTGVILGQGPDLVVDDWRKLEQRCIREFAMSAGAISIDPLELT